MPDGLTSHPTRPLVDQFGRQVTYLRISVTDRCDLRCTYCMAEKMQFLPKQELLTIEELDEVARAFIRRGVQKIRITGGEPLVRRGIDHLFDRLGGYLGQGLQELTLTTNATQLVRHAEGLARAGVKRINVSLDSLNAETFERVTRRGRLPQVLDGIDAALDAGLRIKINTVALKHENLEELPDMIAWAHSKGMDLTLIEVMPLGDTGEDRIDQYIPLPMVRDHLEQNWTLRDEAQHDSNAGPSRYARIEETGGRIGFITPLTNNFCAGCNRVRVTCTGRIYMCLGQDDHIDLRSALRESDDPAAALDACPRSRVDEKSRSGMSLISTNADKLQHCHAICRSQADRMATLLYFGRLSDVTGKPSEELQLPDEVSTAGELRLWLDQRFEANGTLLEPTVRIAVNSEISFDADPIRDCDEIAFMPPVGGG